MQRLPRESALATEFGASQVPQMKVEIGESFVVETNDNFFNLMKERGARPDESLELMRAAQYIKANPVAGPIYVDGIGPGDTLVVEIEDILVRDWGWTGVMSGFGPADGLAEFADLQDPFATVIRHEPGPSGTLRDGVAVMNVGREVSWPLAPFIGTIATAPERGVENTLIGMGPFGGNIDVRDVSAGNRIYLNSTHDGALLFLGDVHGSQGDSELTGLADETAADVTLRCDVIRGQSVPGVFRIETPESLIQVDSSRNAGTHERTLDSCFLNMIRWLRDEFGMDPREAYLHMSANSEVRVRVYQSTTGIFSCGVVFPKSQLEELA